MIQTLGRDNEREPAAPFSGADGGPRHMLAAHPYPAPELVDALDRLLHGLLVLDHAEQITVFLGIVVSHDEKVASQQTLSRLEYKKMIDFEENLNKN